MKKLIMALTIFSLTCSLGGFTGWIGGIEPFTTQAGIMAGSTAFFGIVFAAMILDLTK